LVYKLSPSLIAGAFFMQRLFFRIFFSFFIFYNLGVLIAVLVYWFNPAGNPMIDIISLIAIGFLIYGPVMLIGLQALDLVPKKAAGTAAGLTGLFG